MRILRAGFLSLVLCVATGFVTAAPRWKTFKSATNHFTVSYPLGWYVLEGFDGKAASVDTLDIINFRNSERVRGVVIKAGGAEITVGRAPSEIQSMEQWINENTKFDTEIKQHKIENFARSPSGCTALVEVTSLSEVGPGRNFHRTGYYCLTRHGLYGVWLTNWEGDPNQKNLQAIALKIALSLRSW